MTSVLDKPAPSSDDPPLPPVPDEATMVTLKIFRFNPENPDAQGFESFRVPALPTDRLPTWVLAVLGLSGALVASETAMRLVSFLTARSVAPKRLPAFDFRMGVPEDAERPAEIVRGWREHWDEHGYGTWIATDASGRRVGFVGLHAVGQAHGEKSRLVPLRAPPLRRELAQLARQRAVLTAADAQDEAGGGCGAQVVDEEGDPRLDLLGGVDVGPHAEFGDDGGAQRTGVGWRLVHAVSLGTACDVHVTSVRGPWCGPSPVGVLAGWSVTMDQLCVVHPTPWSDVSHSDSQSCRRPSRPPREPKERHMKVRKSLRSLKNKPGAQVVRRRGKVYVINKKDPRFKARQG